MFTKKICIQIHFLLVLPDTSPTFIRIWLNWKNPEPDSKRCKWTCLLPVHVVSLLAQTRNHSGAHALVEEKRISRGISTLRYKIQTREHILVYPHCLHEEWCTQGRVRRASCGSHRAISRPDREWDRGCSRYVRGPSLRRALSSPTLEHCVGRRVPCSCRGTWGSNCARGVGSGRRNRYRIVGC